MGSSIYLAASCYKLRLISTIWDFKSRTWSMVISTMGYAMQRKISHVCFQPIHATNSATKHALNLCTVHVSPQKMACHGMSIHHQAKLRCNLTLLFRNQGTHFVQLLSEWPSEWVSFPTKFFTHITNIHDTFSIAFAIYHRKTGPTCIKAYH